MSFTDVHREMLHLFPAAPARVLDIGAGSGRDAAALAALGHRVVAVEPTAELRALGRRIHAGRAVEWRDDALPGLTTLRDREERFDLILLTAVWMHLDAHERASALPRIAGLLAPGGRVSMTLRHGPVPTGRRMFDVGAAETIRLAEGHGLHPVHLSRRRDLHGRGGVSWSALVLERDRPGILRTPRLLLRPVETADVPAVRRLWTDPEVRRHLGGPVAEDKVRVWERACVGAAGVFCVVREADGVVTGVVTLKPRARDDGATEVSYQFLPEHWGSGYAREAVAAAVSLASATAPVFAVTQEANSRSRHLLESLGMTLADSFVEWDARQVLYRAEP